MLRERQL